MASIPVIDISHHQATVNFGQVKAAGVVGVIHKATEGSSYIDNRYQERRPQAESAGLLWGAYHFLRPGNMTQQAQHFVSVTGTDVDIYVADHEDAGVSLSNLKTFLREVSRLTGKQQLVIYSGHVLKDQLTNRDEELAQHRLWLCHYTTGTPTWETATWPQWWLWQYTDQGTVSGVSPPTDCNKYQGTDEQLLEDWTGSAPSEPQPDDVPDWLDEMRRITGVTETPGEADNPKIIAMARYIGRKFPDMKSYCDVYQHDSTAWCGLAAGYCVSSCDIRPPFGETDTDKFLWAQSFASDPGYVVLASPRLGSIVVLTREGGGHVTFYERTEGSNFICRGGNQSDAINEKPFPQSDVIALVWPKDAPMPPPEPHERRTVRMGDVGWDVRALQAVLGLPADGEFGPMTEAQVKAFQLACGLPADGIVGTQTWHEVDQLALKQRFHDEGLPAAQVEQITTLAKASPLMGYSWPDRGRSPPGYLPGMALSFAVALTWLRSGTSAADVMARALGNADKDALKWCQAELTAVLGPTPAPGPDMLRQLFVLLIGLGMRESSGQYFEGRDQSASNTSSDTCEAGLFQTSWNIRSANPEIPPLLETFWENPNGFLATFRENLTPNATDLSVYGSGGGAKYQFLAKYSPLFAVMVTAIGLRTLRQHWGPINRHEVTIKAEADALLRDVQALISEAPMPEPEPPPVQATVAVNITAPAGVEVVVNVTEVGRGASAR